LNEPGAERRAIQGVPGLIGATLFFLAGAEGSLLAHTIIRRMNGRSREGSGDTKPLKQN
jgi:hypothetical protein